MISNRERRDWQGFEGRRAGGVLIPQTLRHRLALENDPRSHTKRLVRVIGLVSWIVLGSPQGHKETKKDPPAQACCALATSMRSMVCSCVVVNGLGRKTTAPAAKLSVGSFGSCSAVIIITGIFMKRFSVLMKRTTSGPVICGMTTSRMAAVKPTSSCSAL